MAYRSKEQQTLSEDSSLQMRETEFSSTRYSSTRYSTWEYPVGELGSERYPHFMLFYVNANSRSKILKTNKGSIEAHNIDTSYNTGGTAFSKVLKDTQIGAKISEVVGGVTSNKRIVHAICLPMPAKVRANYDAGYSKTEEVGAIGAVLAAESSGQGMESAEASAKTAKQVAIPGLAGLLGGAGKQLAGGIAARLTGGSTAGKLISDTKFTNPKLMEQLSLKLFGAVINKRQEQIFQSMEFRTHHFQWVFLPRSKEESESIFNIIKLFKENMHPELDKETLNSMLIMPSEFDIEFRSGTEENLRISRVATCVLKTCNVDYTPIGEFITFAGVNDPIAISLDMIFYEMEPLDRSMLANNY